MAQERLPEFCLKFYMGIIQASNISMFIWETGHVPGYKYFDKKNFVRTIFVEAHLVTISAKLSDIS